MALGVVARRNDLIRRMFIDTADMNYVGARAAFFEGRNYDFWWLTLHAAEKYLKAALLMNGATANAANHNLVTLMERIAKVDKRVVLPKFIRPRLAGAERMFDGHNTDFVKWLNIFGSAPNRYATYSYVISNIDIYRADHLIYWARRHARPFSQNMPDGTNIDWVSQLANSPRQWRHHSGAPIERLADLPTRHHARRTLTRANVAFFPELRHRNPPINYGRAQNGAIFNCIQTLKGSKPGSEDRLETRELLLWVKEHLFLPRVEVDEITRLLEAYP